VPEPFISVAELGDYLGQDLTDDEAAAIAVAGASDICRTIAEQRFDYVTDEIIELDGSGTDALLLPELPVESVSAVLIDEESVNGWVLAAAGRLGTLYRRSRWPRGRQNVAVTYTHGYPPEEFPEDVRMVALTIASRLFNQRGPVEFESIGAYSVRYATQTQAPASALEMAILRKYRRIKQF